MSINKFYSISFDETNKEFSVRTYTDKFDSFCDKLASDIFNRCNYHKYPAINVFMVMGKRSNTYDIWLAPKGCIPALLQKHNLQGKRPMYTVKGLRLDIPSLSACLNVKLDEDDMNCKFNIQEV